MRLRHIEVLHAVIVDGTVTGAARALHLTQPAVTHAISALERELGYSLFDRRSGRLVPTAEARLMFQDADALMRQLGSLRELARRLGPATGGSALRIAAAPALCATLLPAAIAAFARERPEVPVALRGMLSAEASQAVLMQQADIAITFGGAPHPALVPEHVARLTVVCIAPRGRFGRRTRLSARDLVRQEVLLAEPVDPLSRALWDACVDAGLHPSRTMRIQPVLGIFGLVREGAAIGIVDNCTASLADPSQVDVLPFDADFGFDVYACHSNARPPGGDGAALVSAVRSAADRLAAGRRARD